VRHLREADAAVGAADAEFSAGELDIRVGRLEQVRGDLLPFEMIFSQAKYRAEPPTAIEREPNVPVPAATAAVSPSTMEILSIATPSRAPRICAKLVAWPWPWLWVPR